MHDPALGWRTTRRKNTPDRARNSEAGRAEVCESEYTVPTSRCIVCPMLTNAASLVSTVTDHCHHFPRPSRRPIWRSGQLHCVLHAFRRARRHSAPWASAKVRQAYPFHVAHGVPCWTAKVRQAYPFYPETRRTARRTHTCTHTHMRTHFV